MSVSCGYIRCEPAFGSVSCPYRPGEGLSKTSGETKCRKRRTEEKGGANAEVRGASRSASAEAGVLAFSSLFASELSELLPFVSQAVTMYVVSEGLIPFRDRLGCQCVWLWFVV